MKPKIGIVVCGLIENKQFVSNAYIQSVKYSGGLPFILPLVKSNEAIGDYVECCDGFLFCGGNDITPLLFGQEPREGIGETHIALDLFQIRLMKKILETQKPVFAICRGMQVLNVACEGTIYQDISLQPGETFNHMQHSFSRKEASHKVSVAANSLLKKIVGRYIFVNSYHHQTIGIPGKGLTISATAADNTVEAVEMPSRPFVLGVQWHPESMYRSSSEMRQLFFSFIQQCSL